MRQLFLFVCFLITVAAIYLNPMWVNRTVSHAALRYQASPLAPPTSPLSVTTTAAPADLPALTTPANGSPISLVLVTLLLAGIVAVIGLIFWRQR